MTDHARVPRPAWLALGAIVAALVLDGQAWDIATASGVAAACVAALALLARRRAVAVLLLAFASIGIRVGLVALLAGPAGVELSLPVGGSEWQGVVEDISSPSGPSQAKATRVPSGLITGLRIPTANPALNRPRPSEE